MDIPRCVLDNPRNQLQTVQKAMETTPGVTPTLTEGVTPGSTRAATPTLTST